MTDNFHVVLSGLLLVQGIGWVFMMKLLLRLLADLSSTEMRIATLVRSLKDIQGLDGTETKIDIVERSSG